MDPALASALARATLYIHFLVVVFNIAALVLIPAGRLLDWRFVRIFWWRALHVGSMLLVAVQAGLGQHCFLTLMQAAFESAAGGSTGGFWLDAIVTRAVFWPLPLETFVVLYLLALGLTVFFWFWVRPQSPFASRSP
jgi:hypothetical protein